MCGQHHAPAAFTPGKDLAPIVQEAGWAPEPVRIDAENLASPGFDPRTPQPVACRYTDYAIQAPNANILSRNSHLFDMLRDLRFSGQSCGKERLLGGDAMWPSMN